MSGPTVMQSTGGAESDNARRSVVSENVSAAQLQIERKQHQIKNVMLENAQIKNEIAAISGNRYDYVKADKLATLQGEVDALERRYQFEKMRKNDLMKRYQLARIDLLHGRKKRGGANVDKEQAEALQRQVDVLENRLDQALCKFNDALSYNKELRDQIDIIREERRVFQRVHKKMEDDLRLKKRTMANRIEQSNKDMDERDEYLRQGEQLRATLAEQQQQYEEQIRGLDEAMLEIKSMRDDQTNLQLELEAREYEFESRLAESNSAQMNTIGTGGTSSGVVRRPFEDGSDDGDDTEETANLLKVDREPLLITDILTRIAEVTNENDVDKIRQQYINLGDRNFSQYKYINELATTKETLEDEIRDLKLLLAEESDSDAQQRRLIKGLEEKLAATETQLEAIQKTIHRQRDAMSAIRGATEDIYSHFNCATIDRCSSGDEATCTETNLMTFLGAIEEMSTHILCAFHRHHRQAARRCGEDADHGTRHSKSSQPGEEEEENALRAGGDSPADEAPLDRVGGEGDIETSPLLPLIPHTAHSAVSAQRLVRSLDLPSANLGTETSNGLDDLDEDRVVSHEEIRKQMEQRLMTRREREERVIRKKKELKDATISNPRHRQGTPTPRKGNR